MSKKIIVILILVLIIVAVAVLAGIFALLQSPAAVNKLAAWMQPVTGISLHVDEISLNRHLNVRVRGVRIETVKDKGFYLCLDQVELRAGTTSGLKIEVEKILLTGPKFTFYIKKTKSKTDPFAVLRKLPPVRLLVVKGGQIVLKSDSDLCTIPGMELTIRDFKPEGGGTLNGQSRFHIRSNGMTGQGSLETTLNFSRFSPHPSGSGFLRLTLDAGSMAMMKFEKSALTTGLRLNGDVLSLDGALATIRRMSRRDGSETINVEDIQVQINGSYDQRTSAFTLPSFAGSAAGVGSVKVRASGTIKPLTWKASLQASSVNLAQVLRLLKPFLPEDYRSWTFKGTGGLALESEGRHADGTTVWNAAAVVDLNEGGFASADGSKAGERMNGRIELRLGSPDPVRKGIFKMTLEGGDGEFLWGPYYQDFKGKRIKVASQGVFAQHPFSLSSSGTFDLFRTGHYTFFTDLSKDRSIFSLDAKDISAPRLFNALLENYISQNYPHLQDMTLEGVFDLKLTASILRQQKNIEGNLSLRGGAVRSPANRLSLTGLNIALPYDLALSGHPSPVPENVAGKGFVAFAEFEKGTLRIGKFESPVVLSGNKFILPNPIHVQIYGGEVRFPGLKVEDLLFPDMRAETGITLENLRIEKLIGEDLRFPLAGRIDGNLSKIFFREGKWLAEGELVTQIFGGRIVVSNLSAGKLLSPARFFGADVTFDAIDLDEVTGNIKFGRMTGLIKGSLRNFKMEYGQPVSFDLVVESDWSRTVPQQISVEAIKNLSIISTGSETISAILNSGVNRFFHEYPYSAIGIRCTLADDIFSLRGLIHEGNNEYLIRRAALRGIDMVNQNPENAISFKDMSERMGRLFQPRKESRDVPSG